MVRPPRSRVGASAASTIASTPRRFASRTIASPARRARTVAVATSTPSYSSPTAPARAGAGGAPEAPPPGPAGGGAVGEDHPGGDRDRRYQRAGGGGQWQLAAPRAHVQG